MDIIQAGLDDRIKKPTILRITQRVGPVITQAVVDPTAPEIEGYLPIELQGECRGLGTQYIAFSNIASFEVLQKERDDVLWAFPIPKVRTRGY